MTVTPHRILMNRLSDWASALMECLSNWFSAFRGDSAPRAESVDTIKKKTSALKQDQAKQSQEEKNLLAQLRDSQNKYDKNCSLATNKSRDCEKLEREIKAAKDECEDLSETIQKLASERSALQHEINEMTLAQLLDKKLTMRCKPGDRFFIQVAVEAVPESLAYPKVVRAEKAFAVPDLLPPITEDASEVLWALSDKRQGKVVVVDDEIAKEYAGRLFFVGDIHGDADSLRRIVEHVFRTNGKSILVFLGDLFDRGDKSIEAIRLLLWTARRFPGQVLWVAGNHDDGFRFDEKTEVFSSSVIPSEFSAWLNEHPEAKDEGKMLVRIIRELPVACIVGNVWASHGGVPQSDVSAYFQSFEAMSEEMLKDCIWSRMKDVPAKIPNRSHSGAEVGFKDAKKFFARVNETTNLSIRHMVCAHQHEYSDGAGCVQFTRYFKPDELSCQCFFSFMDKEHDAEPCYLEFVSNRLPQPYTI